SIVIGVGGGKSGSLQLGDIQPDLVSSFAEKTPGTHLVGRRQKPVQCASGAAYGVVFGGNPAKRPMLIFEH
ncbi:MAG TPA: hypothetical protein VF086_14090, partial [Propionibacteriaceae bacterium]